MKRVLVAGAAAALLAGCAAGAGAVAGATLIGVGVLTHECYQYTTITVIDGVTGHPTCDAEVRAIQDGDEDVLGSCYHAPLTAGHWTLRAELPGRKPALTSVDVKERDACEPAVSKVVLTIPAPGGASRPQPPAAAPAPVTPAPVLSPALSAEPSAEPSPTEATPPPPSVPPVPSAPPSAAPPPAGAPPTEAPPTQSFPD